MYIFTFNNQLTRFLLLELDEAAAAGAPSLNKIENQFDV